MLFLISISGFASGQNYLQTANYQNQTQISKERVSDFPLPVLFRARLNPQPFKQKEKLIRAQDVKVDTVTVDSYFGNPVRSLYSYSSDGFLTIKKNQEEGGNGWVNTTMDSCIYDSVGNKLLSVWKDWTGSAWINSAKNIYTYRTDRKILTSLGEIWNKGKWENSDSSTYTYDIYGNQVSFYKEIWNDSAWVNKTFEMATYDSAGNMLNLTRKTWDDSLGWLKNQRYTFNYDSHKNVLSAIIENGVDYKWQNFYKEVYTYDSVSNKLSYTGRFWKEKDSVWLNSEKYAYTYNIHSYLVTALGQSWDTTKTTWANYVNAQYTHDLYGGTESDYIQRWQDSVWADSALTQYVYDKYGDVIKGDYYTSKGKQWVIDQDGPLQLSYNYNLSHLYFVGYHLDASYTLSGTTGVKNIHSPINRFYCSPNPASSQSVIWLDLKGKTDVDLSLFSLTGQKLKTIFRGSLPKGTYHYPLSLGDLPSGIYFAGLSTNKFARSIKIVWMN